MNSCRRLHCSSAPRRGCCDRRAKTTAPFVDRLLNLGPARPFVARQAASALRQSVRRDQYPAPYAILDLWQRHGAAGTESYEAEARSISELHVHAHIAQFGARVFAAGSAQGHGRQIDRRFSPRARHRRRRHGRRYRRLVGLSRHDRDLAGPLRATDSTGPGPRQGVLRQATQRPCSGGRCVGAAADGRARARASPMPTSSSKPSSRMSTPSAPSTPSSSQSSSRLPSSPPIPPASRSKPWREKLQRSEPPGRHPFLQSGRAAAIGGNRARAATHSRRLLEDALKFTRKLDKLPLPCKSAPGFVVNRILTPYINEAMFALEGGIPAAVIDRAATCDSACPWDRSSWPTWSAWTSRCTSAGYSRTPSKGACPISWSSWWSRRNSAARAAKGFIVWRDGKADQNCGAAIHRARGPGGPADPAHAQRSRRLLREGVIEDADLLDAGAVFATGFAPFRGGPLQLRKSAGVAEIAARLEELARRYGERFRPDPGWRFRQLLL